MTFFEYLFSLDHIRDRQSSNRPQCMEKFSDIKNSQMGEIEFKFSAMVGAREDFRIRASKKIDVSGPCAHDFWFPHNDVFLLIMVSFQ